MTAIDRLTEECARAACAAALGEDRFDHITSHARANYIAMAEAIIPVVYANMKGRPLGEVLGATENVGSC